MSSIAGPSRDHPVRLLVDHSKEAHLSNALTPLEPDDRYHTTRTWEPVTAELLRDYDVLAVCGATMVPHTDEELGAIEGFVRQGGGLLLGANGGAFETTAMRPMAESSANQLAARFGVEFLSPTTCRAKTSLNDWLVRGYKQKHIERFAHPLWGDLDEDEYPLREASPVALPDGADVVLAHRETGEPLAAALRVGEGRVFVIGDTALTQSCGMVCAPIVNWLAAGRHSQPGEAEPIPDCIGGLGGRKKVGDLVCCYEPGLEDRIEHVAGVVGKCLAHLKTVLPAKTKPPTAIELRRTTGDGLGSWRWWGDPAPWLAHASDAANVYFLAFRLFHEALWEVGLATAFRPTFAGQAPKHMALRAMEALGYADEAQHLREQLLTEAEDVPSGFHLFRTYEEHARGFWALHQLEAEHGPGLIERVLKLAPEKDPLKGLPQPFAADTDVMIYFLSLAAETDLFPWFAALGCEVRPLPLVKPGDEGFGAAMRDCAERGLRNTDLPASDRMDAVEALAAMNAPKKDDDKQDKQDPPAEPVPPASERVSDADPYVRLVAAFELARRSDPRGAEALRELASADDEALRAMASLILARCGDGSAAAQLLDLAPRQDVRFALDAGYALEKLGFEGAGKLSLLELTMADGSQPGGIDLEYDGGSVDIFPTVEGYRVGNVMHCHPCWTHFPHNTHLQSVDVGWVHTAPRYRRKNLARVAMARLFEHKLLRRVSCVELGTGTRNVAHALYRSFGFSDLAVSRNASRPLDVLSGVAVPEGVIIRSYKAGDEAALSRLLAELEGPSCYNPPRRAQPARSGEVLKLAERDGEVIGAAAASLGGETAHLYYVWVKEGDNRSEIAAALLERIHAEVRECGAKRISWWSPPRLDYIRNALASTGYAVTETGGVWMWGVVNLSQALGELAPLLEKRLADSTFAGWTGAIDLVADTHRGRVAFTEGKATSVPPESPPPGLLLTCDDNTLNRVLCGGETPFEAYLQLRLTIEPQVNEQITGLLETLFPKVAPST